MRDPADPAAPDETSLAGGGWRDVARVTFHHHLRGPWTVALALVGILPLLVFLVAQGFAGGVADDAPARDLVPFFGEIPRATLPLLLLLLVVPAYRGAWLRDPDAARERVPGFFVGTWAAALAALLPWLVSAYIVAAWKDTVLSATLVALVHFAALALMAAAWIALGMLLAVAFRREETRWVAVAMTYLGLGYLLPYLGNVAVSLWRSSEGAGFGSQPAWGAGFAILNPTQLASLFAATLTPRSYEPLADHAGSLLAGTSLGTLLLLAAWITVPLLLAVRIQSKAEAPLAPLEQPL